MRTGVLADDKASFFEPMNHVAHERHLGLPHIVKHKRNTRKRKQGYRSTTRPQAAYMAHYELAQLLNPDNPREALDGFQIHRTAAETPKPTASFRMLVEQFHDENPSFRAAKRGKVMLPETAYFMQKSGLDPNDYFLTPHNNVSSKIASPLRVILETAVQANPDRSAELQQNYEEAVKLLLNEQAIPAAPYSPFKQKIPPPTPP